MKKDYINIQDFSAEELEALIELTSVVKKASKERALPDLLYKSSIAMIFQAPSTRTRISFEVAMTLLGGHGLYIRPEDIHLGKRETIGDTSKVISRMCDGIVIRSHHYRDIVDMAKYSSVPVINAMADDMNHPAQVLCDAFTMFEKMGRIKKVNLAFVGDSSEEFGLIGRDLMLISSKLGINFYLASPEGYKVEDEFLKQVYKNAELSGSRIVITEEPEEAVAQADFIYTDVWTWYGVGEIEKRLKVFMPRYQVNSELMKKAPPHCKYMHCLPAMRGEEVTDEVIDSKQSIVFDEAENRLYTEEALLIAFIGKSLSPWKIDTADTYYKEINRIIQKLLVESTTVDLNKH